MLALTLRDEFDIVVARRAVRSANLPTLLMVLFHLTGDRKWLRAPYLPSRSRGLDPNDAGGFSDTVQATIRDAALDALTAWAAGKALAVEVPSEELLAEMLSVAMGEPVPPEYVPMAAAEFTSSLHSDLFDTDAAEPAPDGLSAVVIGAGVSGLLVALKLREHGIPTTILEKAPELGGTWRDNRYPGAGVDTPSYLYSYSFFPHRWTRHYPKRDEVAQYLRDMASTFGLLDSIRFGTEVVSASFDEQSQQWEVVTRKGDGSVETLLCSLLVSAVGLLSLPRIPDLPGMDAFRGPMFHSAQWPEAVDLKGKRVAVVGTGASSVQIVPAIADEVAELKVFQRTPQWVAPAANYFSAIDDDIHWLMEHVPLYYEWYRLRLAWIFNDKIHASLQIDPDWPRRDRSLNEVNDAYRSFFIRHALSELEGRPDLQEKVVPSYPPFGKRMLLDNHWYATLKRENVELITDEVAGFTEGTVVTAGGAEYEVDVVVLATGFRAQQFLYPMDIRGRDGRTLADRWDDDNASAYLGIMTPEFPNLLLMYGPNTNAAGGSYIFIAECQAHYVIDLVTKMQREGIASVEPRPDVHDSYNRRVDEAHSRMVWSHTGMDTYYRNSRGRVVTNLPWRVVEYWAMTRQADLDDYVRTPVDTAMSEREPLTGRGSVT